MPIQSLQKALLSLSFKVRDITGGIGAAKWHNGCQFCQRLRLLQGRRRSLDIFEIR